mgnify:CR=1 FL=1|tara:strand:+ start:1662 stop:2114 length:453 start_codon:yes stop_codon:yes gene_type:complete
MEWLVAVVAFSGFVLGYLLKRWIPEEKNFRKKYQKYVEGVLLTLLAVVVLYLAYPYNFLSIALIVIGLVIAWFVKEPYIFLALTLLSFNFYAASLVFMFGLVNGSKDVLRNALLFFFPFLLLFIPYSMPQLILLGAGACIGTVIRSVRFK